MDTRYTSTKLKSLIPLTKMGPSQFWFSSLLLTSSIPLSHTPHSRTVTRLCGRTRRLKRPLVYICLGMQRQQQPIVHSSGAGAGGGESDNDGRSSQRRERRKQPLKGLGGLGRRGNAAAPIGGRRHFTTVHLVLTALATATVVFFFTSMLFVDSSLGGKSFGPGHFVARIHSHSSIDDEGGGGGGMRQLVKHEEEGGGMDSSSSSSSSRVEGFDGQEAAVEGDEKAVGEDMKKDRRNRMMGKWHHKVWKDLNRKDIVPIENNLQSKKEMFDKKLESLKKFEK